MTFKEKLASKAKAVLAGTGILVAGFAEWLVQNPDTATEIEKVIPAPWDQLVPVILGGAGTWLVHHVPNATPAAPVVEPSLNTTAIASLSAKNSGEFTGPGAY